MYCVDTVNDYRVTWVELGCVTVESQTITTVVDGVSPAVVGQIVCGDGPSVAGGVEERDELSHHKEDDGDNDGADEKDRYRMPQIREKFFHQTSKSLPKRAMKKRRTMVMRVQKKNAFKSA